MKCMRQLNLFSQITRVRSKHCFPYNNTLIFAVPYHSLSKALGEKAENIGELSLNLGKKIKIVAIPRGLSDAERFIRMIILPIKFNELKLNKEIIEISANMQNKASLFGRNKTRFFELEKIIREFFNKQLRIV